MGNTVRAVSVPTLIVSNNYNTDRAVYQLVKPATSVGRDPACEIVLDSPFVSGQHVRIERSAERFFLVHPHPARKRTQNGLRYQGDLILGDEAFRHDLKHGDVFRIGDEHGMLVTLAFDDGSGRDIAPEIHPIDLKAQEISIGRLNDNMVVLAHPQVSAHHARLVSERGTYRIIDLGSTNHVYVNGVSITSQLLEIDDEIRIGPFKFVFQGSRLIQQDESKEIRIEACHLKKQGNNGVTLLNDISLTIPPRTFAALLGPSGAGKSTLMDALNGFRPADKGQVLYNGQDYYTSLAAFRTQIGYVPQEDIVHRELTVERALYYAAKMRLPKDFTNEQIMERIDEVLKDVELTERRHLIISKLSGGQRKRVSIALELLAKPTIFFFDEPTSGLDPGLDRKLMQLLRNLADRGHTIILVTHSVANINSCDYVCFVAQGGYLAYFGPPQGVNSHFGSVNFAEVYNLIEPTEQDPNIPKKTAERFAFLHGMSTVSSGSQRTGKLPSPERGNAARQFWFLVLRYLELLKNDWSNLLILLLQAPIIGLILLGLIVAVGRGGFDPGNVVQCPTTASVLTADGVPDLPTPYHRPVTKDCAKLKQFLQQDPRGKVYAAKRGGVQSALQDFITSGPGYAPTILFIMAFSAVMFGCINAGREIVKEAAIYRRERAVNLGILPYVCSKFVVLGILCLLQSAILVGLVSIVNPFHQGIAFPSGDEVYITVALTSLVGMMMGLTTSACVSNTDRAMSFIPLLLIPQVIFSGSIFPLTTWGLQGPGALFAVRWAMAAMGSSIGLHSDKLNGDALFGDNYTYHGLLYSTYSPADARQYLLLTWLVLIGMIVIFGIATACILKWKEKIPK
jgi:ABC-type multidrug transport system ATPase subunit/pSer/pThr/pTyr-binding forkhead associated (FHA) protein